MVVALTLSVAALGAISAWPDAPMDVTGREGFRIAGSAEGLRPGVPGRLTVTVRNPYGFAIRVMALRGSARDSGACSAGNVRLARLSRPLVVSARGTRRLVLPILLAADAPNVCQGARFPLQFSGRAVRA